ncbi:MAG TPA: YihY/virulence factor BrkB family protein [Acidimicrobiales bacterium]|nr:YihY/virulence factor BrkB family protein [Acidimicrobiales bacterium]
MIITHERSVDERRAREPGRGRQADHPRQFPRRAWIDVGRRVVTESRDDNVPLLAAGVAFYALISLVPAMAAVIATYGLVADPAEVADQMASLSEALPAQAGDLLVEQVERIAASSSGALGAGAALALATALWTASSGMRWMMSALSLTYDQRETRTFLRLRGRALLLTIAATAALVVSVGLIAALPAVCGLLGIRETGVLVAGVLRWPLLAALVLVGFSALYRFGPDRAPARWRWVTPGSLVATVIWLAASAGFALYAAVAGSFDETYGPLGGVVVLLLWLHLSSLAVLVGAEGNAEMEHQTARDTTTGPDRPLGARGAVVADTVGASSQERRTPPDGVDSSPDRE